MDCDCCLAAPHLFCRGVVAPACHRRILLGPRPICPICRMRLSRNNPSRNRFAERVKDEMQVSCTNAPCPELVKHAELPKHLSSCGFRPTKCSFRPLGCDWNGPVNQRGRHEKESEHRKATRARALFDSSLIAACICVRVLVAPSIRWVRASCWTRSRSETSNINKRRKRSDPPRRCRHTSDTHSKPQPERSSCRLCAAADSVCLLFLLCCQLCRMLSKRCRDMVIRDLLIEMDPHTGELATHPFRAVGLSWEVVMDKAPTGQQRSRHARKRARAERTSVLTPVCLCCTVSQAPRMLRT